MVVAGERRGPWGLRCDFVSMVVSEWFGWLRKRGEGLVCLFLIVYFSLKVWLRSWPVKAATDWLELVLLY